MYLLYTAQSLLRAMPIPTTAMQVDMMYCQWANQNSQMTWAALDDQWSRYVPGDINTTPLSGSFGGGGTYVPCH
jgi:hypothetical protein